jgi:hypothetical protein
VGAPELKEQPNIRERCFAPGFEQEAAGRLDIIRVIV